MPQNNAELLKRLRATFRVEAEEHLGAMAAGLQTLAAGVPPAQHAQAIETMFREAHSLKGAARAVNLPAVEALCHPLESVFALLKQQRIAASDALIELLHQVVEALRALAASELDSNAPVAPPRPLMDRLNAAASNVTAAVRPPLTPPRPLPVEPATSLATDTVRIATPRLDAAMRRAEELLGPRLAAAQRLAEIRDAGSSVAARAKQRRAVQPAIRAIERASSRHRKDDAALAQVLEHVEAEDGELRALERRLARLEAASAEDCRTLARLTDALHDEVRQLQLLPLDWILEGLPRFVAELARDSGKDAELKVQGGDIAVDRRILEALKAPLIHLLRNAVDHGIERPAQRIAAGKPPRGTVTVRIAHERNAMLELRVSDDGAGVDADRVRAAAGKLNLAAPDAASQGDALELVFRSGVSTSPMLTDLSGRGLGLAIVREKIQQLGGTVALSSQPGAGATFCIVMPLTLAIMRAVRLQTAGRGFAIPTAGIERVVRLRASDIRTVQNRPTIALDGQPVVLAELADVLELPAPRTAADPQTIVVVSAQGRRAGLRIDELGAEQAVLIKPLGPQLARVPNVAGACVLGNGETVLVLSVPEVLASALRGVKRSQALESPVRPVQPPAVLVAEDSITSRSLLKGILEAAGYRVSVAVDGADAWASLKTGSFNLLVSDVEMPRMDGLTLTARIRADRKLAELPVVLVTALSSPAQRERGIDAGANAYIVKSTFDQTSLLEVIERLVGPGAAGLGA